MKIPAIKENRLSVLLKTLECIEEYKFNREKMRECVLDLYPHKSEKSVFRGIAIPTLRHIGLIVGYGEYIRPSAHGRLLLKSRYNNKIHQNVIKTVFLELDKGLFGFIDHLKKLNSEIMPYPHFERHVEGPEEYKKRWLKILNDCKLVKLTGGKKWINKKIILIRNDLSLIEKNLDYKRKERFFKTYLFNVYKKISLESAGIMDIDSLRGEVALKVLEGEGEIITEGQFDYLLQKTPLVTDDYIISLSRPMGAEEKLFELNEKYYRTLSIKIFTKKERMNNDR